VLDHVVADLEVVFEGETFEVVGDVELNDAEIADLLGKIFGGADLVKEWWI
jgi:hypothetical protein